MIGSASLVLVPGTCILRVCPNRSALGEGWYPLQPETVIMSRNCKCAALSHVQCNTSQVPRSTVVRDTNSSRGPSCLLLKVGLTPAAVHRSRSAGAATTQPLKLLLPVNFATQARHVTRNLAPLFPSSNNFSRRTPNWATYAKQNCRVGAGPWFCLCAQTRATQQRTNNQYKATNVSVLNSTAIIGHVARQARLGILITNCAP